MMAIFGVCFPYIHHIEGEIGQGRYSLLCHGPWLCWHFGSLGWTTCSPRSTVVWTKTRFNEDRTNESAHSSRSWVLLYIRLQKTATLLFVWSINPKTCTSLRKEKTRSLKVTKSLNKPYIKSIWNFSKMIYIYIYISPSTHQPPMFLFQILFNLLGLRKKKQLFTTFRPCEMGSHSGERNSKLPDFTWKQVPSNVPWRQAAWWPLELLEVKKCDMPGPDINFFASIFRIKILTSWHDQLNTYQHNSQRVVIMNSFFSCS